MPYTATIEPATMSLPVGGEEVFVIKLNGDAPIHLGQPGHSDRDTHVRLTLDSAIVKVDKVANTSLYNVEAMQSHGPTTDQYSLICSYTQWGEKGDFVIHQYGDYLDPPFEIVPGGLYTVKIKGVAKGTAELKLSYVTMDAAGQYPITITGGCEITVT